MLLCLWLARCAGCRRAQLCQPNSEGFLSVCADYGSSDGVTGEGTQLIITGGRLLSRQPVKVYFVTCLPEYIAIILLLLKQVE